MIRLTLAALAATIALPAFATIPTPGQCIRAITGKSGDVLYCTRDLSLPVGSIECDCTGRVMGVDDSDGLDLPTKPTRPTKPGHPVDPDDDKEPPTDPADPPDPVDPVDPVDPPTDAKDDKDKDKDNSGHGNGDEGDCKGNGCTDPDNPGKSKDGKK